MNRHWFQRRVSLYFQIAFWVLIGVACLVGFLLARGVNL